MKVFAGGNSFNCDNLGAICLSNRNKTAIYEFAVNQDTAGSTFSFAATFLGPCKPQTLPQNI